MIEPGNHTLSIENRKRLVADGVKHVGTFTQKEVRADTSLGHLVLKGEGLYITDLNLEIGRLVVEGTLQSVTYVEEKRTSKKGLWERLTR
ncbi:MAG: sporulation protein YabP [Firmicutes bacterium]|nr:sporulation protein YabP [Bacillota bacterium]